MDKKVISSVRVRNNIQHLIESGIIDGDLGDTWTRRTASKRAVDDANKLANAGNVRAMCMLGRWYLSGENELPQHEKKALEWYKRAARAGDAEGALAVERIEGKKKIKAAVKSAQDGDQNAMYNLGRWYANGRHGLDKDDAMALTWWKSGSDRGCVKSTARYGSYLISGRGTSVNLLSEGLILLVSAAKDGSDYACFCLGECYLHGRFGIRKDTKLAKSWLRKAVRGCKHKHLSQSYVNKALLWIGQIN